MFLYTLGFESVPGWAADKDWAMITIVFFQCMEVHGLLYDHLSCWITRDKPGVV